MRQLCGVVVVCEETGGCTRTAVRVTSVIVYADVLGRNAVPKNSYNFSKLYWILPNGFFRYNLQQKLSNTCEEFKFRGWYDAAFRLGQETRQILFEFQQTR